jgi:hypothetical protein
MNNVLFRISVPRSRVHGTCSIPVERYTIVYLPLALWPTWQISSDPTFGGFETVPCAGKI